LHNARIERVATRSRTAVRPAARGGAKAARRVADEDIDFGPLAGWIGFHLRMAQIASFQNFGRLARDLDLSPGRFAALTVIGRNPGISQTQLSRAIGSDKSTLTPALSSLVKRNLVRRTRTENDRRAYRLKLTPAGEKMLRDLTECARRHEADLDRVVGPRMRAPFLRTLKKIAEELG
jgi:DNA-binding MarR family transcriptional regulator